MRNYKIIFVFILVVFVTAALSGYLAYRYGHEPSIGRNPLSSSGTPSRIDFSRFTSESDLRNYLQHNSNSSNSRAVGMTAFSEKATDSVALPQNSQFGMTAPSERLMAPPQDERYSQTNVQVMGIDEPDVVKNNAHTIFTSIQNYSYGYTRTAPVMNPKRSMDLMPPLPPEQMDTKTKIIEALQPSTLKKIGSIDEMGDLLLSGNMLVVFGNQKISGYDITNASSPSKKWEQNLKSSTRVVQSRLMNNQIYVILESTLSPARPCPYDIMTKDSVSISIPCTEIYHPNYYINANATITVMKMSPTSGDIAQKTSFVSTSYETTVSMFPESLYIAYPQNADMFTVTYQFLKEQGSGLVDTETMKRIEKLVGYDISNQAKLVELETILSPILYPSDEDGRLKLQNEMQNKYSAFAKQHKRDFEKTAIVRIDVGNLSVTKTGSVPGRLLNQFALDEYDAHLRVATTVGEGIWGFGFGGGSQESANDVYVLDKNLTTVGKVVDLGGGERIYSVRFIGSKGYLVTFKQTDPFYILDLSKPTNPLMTGELKIPGYSAYLHPLSDTVMLGIGKDGVYTKATLFDVSNPTAPRELDTYVLKDYNSDILQTHHAFLHDPKYTAFFVPGDTGGYVFSYKNNKLEMVKAVADINPQRAVYMNNTLYIIAGDKVVGLQEGTWNQVGSLAL